MKACALSSDNGRRDSISVVIADFIRSIQCGGTEVEAEERRIEPKTSYVYSKYTLVSRSAMATRLQQIVNGALPSAGWEKCWVERVTPWDLGGVTPVVKHLVEQGQLPQGRCLVPGCGSGYDVVELANPSRHVVGLDISQTALEQATELVSKSTKQKWIELQAGDFFSYSVQEPFDLIFDYTFFCALEPALRSSWAQKMSELLSPSGELITLMFPVGDHDGGPPYAVTPEIYKAVLEPRGLYASSLEDNEFSIAARKGREILGRWSRQMPRM